MTSTMTSSRRDGGYAWVIVVAFFLTEVVVDGIRFSFGVLFVELQHEYGSGKGETAWIGSIMVGIYNLCGPIFAMIVTKLGCRKACFVGSLIVCVGFISSYFTTKLYQLYFTYGLFLGFGYGLLYLAGTVTISRYFFKRRALAIGLSCCGSGVGQFLMTPFYQILVDHYTWRGAMFICAGLSLNCCVFGSLYRPFVEDTTMEHELSIDCEKDDVDEVEQSIPMLNGAESGSIRNGHCNGAVTHNGILNGSHMNGHTIHKGIVNGGNHPPIRTFAQMREEQLNNYKHKSRSNFGSSKSLAISIVSQTVLGSTASFESIIAMKLLRKKEMSHLSRDEQPVESDGEEPNVFKISVIERMFPKRLMTDVRFLIMMMTSFLYAVSSFIPYSMLPDYAIQNGVPQRDSVWLISAMGIGGIVGRIAVGILTDIPCVNRLLLFGTCLLLCGVATVMIPLMTTFSLLMVYSFVFGFNFGSIYVVQPCLLIQYFGEETIVEILGVLMFVIGLSVTIGSPCAGWLYDITKDYNVSVVFAGIVFIVSGLSNFLVLCTGPRPTDHEVNSKSKSKSEP